MRAHRLPLALSLLLVLTAPAGAQSDTRWALTFGATFSRFAGAADVQDPAPGDLEDFRPGDLTQAELGLSRQLGAWQVGVRIGGGSAGLRGSADGEYLELGPVFDLAQGALFVGRRVARFGTGATLHLQAGPVVQVWSGEEIDRRSRLGATVGLSLDVPLGRRTGLVVRGHLGGAASPFEQDELVTGGFTLERETLLLSELGVAFRVGL